MSGNAYGRQKGARMCARHNRGIRKDEEVMLANPSKKRRCEPPQQEPGRAHMPLLPTLPVVDKNIVITGLMLMLRMTEQAAADRTADPQAQDDCKKSIAAIKKYLNDLKQTPNSPS